VVLDVADQDGAPRTSVMTGSANLTYSGLRLSDEAQLRLTVQEASSQYAEALEGVHAAYLRSWNQLAQVALPCVGAAPQGTSGVQRESGVDQEPSSSVRLAPPGEPNTPDPEELG